MMRDRLHDRLAPICIGWLGSMERLVKSAFICALTLVHDDHPPLATIAPREAAREAAWAAATAAATEAGAWAAATEAGAKVRWEGCKLQSRASSAD